MKIELRVVYVCSAHVNLEKCHFHTSNVFRFRDNRDRVVRDENN